jgi:hypothetical protein
VLTSDCNLSQAPRRRTDHALVIDTSKHVARLYNNTDGGVKLIRRRCGTQPGLARRHNHSRRHGRGERRRRRAEAAPGSACAGRAPADATESPALPPQDWRCGEAVPRARGQAAVCVPHRARGAVPVHPRWSSDNLHGRRGRRRRRAGRPAAATLHHRHRPGRHAGAQSTCARRAAHSTPPKGPSAARGVVLFCEAWVRACARTGCALLRGVGQGMRTHRLRSSARRGLGHAHAQVALFCEAWVRACARTARTLGAGPAGVITTQQIKLNRLEG